VISDSVALGKEPAIPHGFGNAFGAHALKNGRVLNDMNVIFKPPLPGVPQRLLN